MNGRIKPVVLDSNVIINFINKKINALPGIDNTATEDTVSRILNHQFPTIAELKAEAERKAAEREACFKATGKDPLQEFCGCLKDVFDEDGVAIQRKMRDEWD